MNLQLPHISVGYPDSGIYSLLPVITVPDLPGVCQVSHCHLVTPPGQDTRTQLVYAVK